MKDPVGAIGTQHTRSSLGGNTYSPALVLTCPSQSPPAPRSGTKTALEHCPGLGPGTKRPVVLRGQWMPPQAAFAFGSHHRQEKEGSHRWHLGSPHAEKICLPYCCAYRLFVWTPAPEGSGDRGLAGLKGSAHRVWAPMGGSCLSLAKTLAQSSSSPSSGSAVS